jgi:Asp-tRNA(Asn)/Glu-tRNA(Gln) amidotransferase A subunit family amidase
MHRPHRAAKSEPQRVRLRGVRRCASRRKKSGSRGDVGPTLGPLHGVPSAIKDLFDFKPGWPFTFGGVRAMRDCAQWHCVFAERVEKAGAILLGKTNSPTMGLRGTCDNDLFGPTRNPFSLAKNTGGSSGGSAAAVADASSRSRKGQTRAARFVFRPPGAMSLASSRPSAGCLS